MDTNCQLCIESEEECILHCEKTEENGWFTLKDDGSKDWKISEGKRKDFWEEIEKQISKITTFREKYSKINIEMQDEYKYEHSKYEFNKIVFPVSTFDKLEYKSFVGLNKKINLYFSNCRFIGKIDFSLIEKAGNITFNECHFCDDIEFKQNEYKHLFLFENCHVHKKAIFQNITFYGTTSFIGTEFYDELRFIHTKFEGMALLNEMKIKKLEFDNTFFKDESNFLNIKNEVGKKLKIKNIANRETARIIKHSFEKQNNIIEANKFYALEMEKQEQDLGWNGNFTEKLIFTFHKISSNHSQDWVLTLFWIINITLGITFLQFELIEENILIYFISVVFINLISIFICGLLISKIDDKYRIIFSIVFSLMFYSIYSFTTNDYSLCYVSNNMNPFSIMTAKESITASVLLYKVAISYLIYQFIVSIRQNTRRK